MMLGCDTEEADMDDATDHSSIRVMAEAPGGGPPGYAEIWSSQA